jgi:hypothetical protein
VPVLAGTTPTSPANENAPRVFGTAPAGSLVRLYTDATCTGTPVAQAPADGTGGFSVTVSVVGDSSTTFYATATPPSGQASACSSTGLTFREDSTAPGTPLLGASSPPSPANETAPRLVGTAEAGATVRIHTDATCSGTPVVQGEADASGAFSLGVTVTDGSTTSFHASVRDAAGNVSACSSVFTYREDSTAPAAPALTGTTPVSPSNDNTPRVNGAAEPFATVLVFTTADCAGAPAAQGEASSSGAFAVPVDVPADAHTSFFARARDAAGNLSSCGGGLAYTEDSTPPVSPELRASSPVSPSSVNTPTLQGAAEPSTAFRIYTNATCSGTAVAQGTSNTEGVFLVGVTVASNTTTTFHASTVDPVGNASACSPGFVYVEDSSTPAPPVLGGLTPSSPANHNAPLLSGTAEPGARVRLYTASGCQGSSHASGEVGPEGTFSIPVSVRDNTTTTFYASTVDTAGNVSGCTSGLSYTEDSRVPSVSSVSTAPTSPGSSNTPWMSVGTSEPAVTVKVFLNDACTGTPVASGQTDGSTFHFQRSVPSDSVTRTFVILTDKAGNTSACLAGPVYTEDSTPPAAPVLTATTPASPANANSPVFQGTAEPGARVQFHAGTACAGAVLHVATADASGAFSQPVAVGDNTTTSVVAMAFDAAGNASPCSAARTYVEDSLAPSASSAFVLEGVPGAAQELDYLNSLSSLPVSWTGFTDAVGITRYELSLSTTSTCPGTAVPPQDVGAGRSAVVTGLSLSEQRYFTCMRAFDGAGNASSWKASNGFVADVTPPTVVSLIPGDGSTTSDPWGRFVLYFSETTLDFTTVTEAAFQVTANGDPVSGAVYGHAVSGAATFAPHKLLPYDAPVSLTVSGVKDLAGNVMAAPFTWNLRTRARRWSPSWALSGHIARNNPAVAMDDQGRAYVLYIESSYRARNYSPTQGWDQQHLLNTGTNAYPREDPSFALSASGRMVGAMCSEPSGSSLTQVYGATHNVGYTFWTTPQALQPIIPGTPMRHAHAPRVAADLNGNASAVWYEYDSGTNLWTNQYTEGRGWGPAKKLRTINQGNWNTTSSGYDLAADAGGTLVFVWSEGGAALHFTRKAPGAAWAAVTEGPAVAGTNVRPQLAFSADGTGLVLWENSTLVDNVRVSKLYASLYQPEGGFGPAQALPAPSFQASSARVGMDASGNALAVWRQATSTSDELWASRYVKDTGWEAPVRVSTAVTAADVAVTPDGTALAVYGYSESSSNTPVWSRRYVPGTGWGTAARIDTSGNWTGTVGGLRVEPNPTGGAIAVWMRYTSSTSTVYGVLYE